jgi:CPA2 family monovalent cation:H+ antiporter-2
MPHETALIATVAMGLVMAFAAGFLALKLRLPPLVGYLLAGVAVGPFTPGFVGDEDLAGQLAEIGVILLMFGVGLHFSIRDLMAVRKIAIPGAVGQIAVGTALGCVIALLWGWSFGAGLVFGLALSVASTVVLLRALAERNLLDSPNGRIAVGWLIVEDLAMVLALVLLPALAGVLGGDARGLAGHMAGGSLGATLALTLGKVGLFLGLVLIVGKRVVPWVLGQAARTGSRELFTLAVLATALGIAYGSAELFGVSFALGAFFAGVVLSETDFSHRAAADSLPLQDAFAVLFFVSVGMLFDPSILVREPFAVLTVLLVIMIGKSAAAFAIVLAFRRPLGTALTVSASLAQIGEFSFILAGLGIALGLLPPEGRDLILAGALLSITLNPLVFVVVDRLGAWFRDRPELAARLDRAGGETAAVVPEQSGYEGPSGQVVLIGYGRVGSVVGQGLQSQGLPLAVVEQDRRRIEELRAGGFTAIYGDAARPGVLELARIDRARLIVIAMPEGFQTQRVLELVREMNPGIDIAVRAHSEGEVANLEREHVGIAIMGERELAFGLLSYALRSLGTAEDVASRVAQQARISGEGGAFERRNEAPARGAPELRQHRGPDDEHDGAPS